MKIYECVRVCVSFINMMAGKAMSIGNVMLENQSFLTFLMGNRVCIFGYASRLLGF